MKNSKRIKGTNVSEKDLRCNACSGTYKVFHCLSYHDGRGLFFAKCDGCGREKNFDWKTKIVTHSKMILTDAFSVLDALGGDISGEYENDCERTPHVYYSRELYEQAYQISEQP